MKVFTSYSVKIKHYNHIFKDTVAIYRSVVDYLINVCLKEWDDISGITENLRRQQYVCLFLKNVMAEWKKIV